MKIIFTRVYFLGIRQIPLRQKFSELKMQAEKKRLKINPIFTIITAYTSSQKPGHQLPV